MQPAADPSPQPAELRPLSVRLVELDTIPVGVLAGLILKLAVAALPTLLIFGILFAACNFLTGRH